MNLRPAVALCLSVLTVWSSLRYILKLIKAEILLPPTYKFYKTVGLFARIICEGKTIYASIDDNSYSDKSIKEISIIQNLI